MGNEFWTATEFWAAIVGAVVGAFAGGFIAFVLQRQSLLESRNQREEDRQEKRRALGHALLFKVGQINSNTAQFHMHMEEAWAHGLARSQPAEPCMFVRPIINLPDPVHFSVDEMALVLSFKDEDLFNSMVSLDTQHNGVLATFAAYTDKRTGLFELLPPGADLGEGAFGIELDADQLQRIRPLMIEVNMLAEDMRRRAKGDFERSEDCLQKLLAFLETNLNLKYGMETKEDYRHLTDPPPATPA